MKRLISLVMLASTFVLLLMGCSYNSAGAGGTEDATFTATILEIYTNSVLVEAAENDDIRRSSDKITFGISGIEDIKPQVGDKVSVIYSGAIMESYPAQVVVSDWSIISRAAPVDDTAEPLPVTAEYISDDVYMSIELPEGWVFSDISDEDSELRGVVGITFNPEDESRLILNLEYYKNSIGICGTGVTFTEMTFANGYTATACIETSQDFYWFFLIYDEPYGKQAVSCTVPPALWVEYEDVIIQILDTVSFENPDAV